MKTRVLVADDHETVRRGLILVIGEQPDMEVVAEAGDGAAAVERAGALAPDVAVLDITMPGMNGLRAARGIRTCSPNTAVVALTRHSDVAYIKELMAAGATGYVLKQSTSSELLQAIRAVARGQQYLDASIAARSPAGTLTRPGTTSAPLITERERQVLKMMALGHSNKDIANALDVALKTVEAHKSNAMRKLGLTGRIEVIRYASLQGWLGEP